MLISMLCAALAGIPFQALTVARTDTIVTSSGPLAITFLGHGTLMMTHGRTVIHIDPWRRLADYRSLPKADLILVTHHHTDHLDTGAIALVRGPKTVVVANAIAAGAVTGSVALSNGDRRTIGGIEVEAVPAYNLVHKRDDGRPFHPKGEGNGYVLTIGGVRVYIAGDTENTEEMKGLKRIDIAFLPMNLPYTMTPAMVADAVRGFKPRILYPYHFGETDTAELGRLLKDVKEVELRIRPMK